MKKTRSNWYVYIVRCHDDTLYTGITTDVVRRVKEHNGEGRSVGAKYTAARRPVTLVYQEGATDKSAAARREYEIRTLPRVKKEQLLIE